MTSHERHYVPNHRSFDCLLNSLCWPTSKKHQSPRYWPFVRRISGDWWMPLHKGPIIRKSFNLMTLPMASYQIRNIVGAHAPEMPGTFPPPPRVSDPDMHHGTCVTHVLWFMPGSLTSVFLWSRRREKTFPAFPAHAQPVILRIWQEAHDLRDHFTGKGAIVYDFHNASVWPWTMWVNISRESTKTDKITVNNANLDAMGDCEYLGMKYANLLFLWTNSIN